MGRQRVCRLHSLSPAVQRLGIDVSKLAALADGVRAVATCDLRVAGVLPVAIPPPEAVETNWQTRLAANPSFFNGVIHLLHDAAFTGRTFAGSFFRTDFKTYLYWRDGDAARGLVRDCFGSALIRSAEGHVLLGRQRAGGINAGLAYPPGGFIDPRDIADDRIDIEASIAREIGEETGLAMSELERVPGYRITVTGPLVSIGIEYRSALSSSELRRAILAHIAADPNPELSDALIVTSTEKLEAATPAYAKLLVASVFDRA